MRVAVLVALLPAASAAVTTILAVTVAPAYFLAIFLGTLIETANGLPGTSTWAVVFGSFTTTFLGLAAACAFLRLGVIVNVLWVVTFAGESQLTEITSGLPAPPPPGRSPVTFTAQLGAMLSTNVASADACGSLSWRTLSPLRSTNATIVSAPAFVPGSTIVALPAASIVAALVAGLAPPIVYRSGLPVNAVPDVSFAVATNTIGVRWGAPALVLSNCSAAGRALRTVTP